MVGLTLPMELITPVMDQGRGSGSFLWDTGGSPAGPCALGLLCVCGEEPLIT